MDARLLNLEARFFTENYPLTACEEEITAIRSEIPTSRTNSYFRRISQIQLVASTLETISSIEESIIYWNKIGRTHIIAKNALLENIAQYAYDYPSFNWTQLCYRICNFSTLLSALSTYTEIATLLENDPTDDAIIDNIEMVLQLMKTTEKLAYLSPLINNSFLPYVVSLKNIFLSHLREPFYTSAENLLSENPLLKGVTKHFLETLYNRHHENEIGDMLLSAIDNLPSSLTFTYNESLEKFFLIEQEEDF